MKKIVSLLLTLVIVIFIPMNTFAINNTVKISEYQIIRSLQSKSDDELRIMGMKNEDIQRIKSFDYKRELEKRSRLDINQLKDLGYKKEQVKQLKEFKGTEAEINALTAYVYISSSSYLRYNGNHDWIVKFWWTWSSCPVWAYTDLIGMGWVAANNGYAVATDVVTDHIATAYYSDGTSKNLSVVPLGGGHAQVTVPDGKSDPDGTLHWNTNGTGYVHIHSYAVMTSLEYRAGYGHSYTTMTPSLSIGKDCSFGFSPSVSIHEEDYTYHNFTS